MKELATLPDDAFVGKTMQFSRLIIVKNGKQRVYPSETVIFTAQQSRRIVASIKNIIEQFEYKC